MIDGKSVLAIIPARGGSKRLPNKNILDLAGKPMIVWSIEAGLKSKYIDEVVVSSDSYEILNISNEYGAQALKRPLKLANDTATTFETIKHAIKNVGNYDCLVLLQPTSPLRKENHIDEALELLKIKHAHAVVSVSEMEHNPLWSNTIPKDDNMSHFIQEDILNKRSQDFEKYYRINGAIYICDTIKFLENKGFFLKKRIYAYKMNKRCSIDIDDNFDFNIAEALIEK